MCASRCSRLHIVEKPQCFVYSQRRGFYSQTFEKRSSLAPNPPAGFVPLVLVFPPVLLVHPPNSSSAATFGAALKPPDAPGTMGVLASVLLAPPQPKSLVLPKPGLFTVGLLAGSDEAHALPPQTSVLDRLLELNDPVAAGAAGVVAAGVACGIFDERLNTEFVVVDGSGLLGGGDVG